MSESKVALVIGAGDATGGAVARRFAREGFFTCVTRRRGDKLASLVQRIEQDGGKARAFGSDARREDEVTALFASIEQEIGPIEVVAFNVGGNVRFPIRETTTRVYTKVWEMCALGGAKFREAWATSDAQARNIKVSRCGPGLACPSGVQQEGGPLAASVGRIQAAIDDGRSVPYSTRRTY